MRSFLLILSITVASVLAVPTNELSNEELLIKDTRENNWRKMKVALPDGYYPGDEHRSIKEPAYKHKELNEHINITPLLPFEQNELNNEHNIVTEATTGRGYKKFMDLDNKSILPNRIQQKKMVGKDLNGQTRYIDIPYYDRSSNT